MAQIGWWRFKGKSHCHWIHTMITESQWYWQVFTVPTQTSLRCGPASRLQNDPQQGRCLLLRNRRIPKLSFSPQGWGEVARTREGEDEGWSQLTDRVEVLVYTAAWGMLVNQAARSPDKIRIIQVCAVCPGVWPLYSTLGAGNWTTGLHGSLLFVITKRAGPC